MASRIYKVKIKHATVSVNNISKTYKNFEIEVISRQSTKPTTNDVRKAIKEKFNATSCLIIGGWRLL